MITPSRLFTRICEQHQDSKSISSENLVISLLDEHINDSHLRRELSQLSNCHYSQTNNMDECSYLIIEDRAKNSFIILIISNAFFNSFHQKLLEILPQLSRIYIYDCILYDQSLPADLRICDMFDDVRLLCKKIDADIQEKRFAHHISEGVEYVLQDTQQFFWHRFFIKILSHLKHTEIAKHEIFPRIRELYQDNQAELARIDEFKREYRADLVIRWYTRDCFFYRLQNGALRKENINDIFLWRAYIQELDRSLRMEHKEQIRSNFSKHIYLYRGQLLHTDDIERHGRSIGQLITMTSFLSTTAIMEIAIQFAGSGISTNSPLQSVVYRISVALGSVGTTCLCISQYSSYQEEEEYLFSLRAMFRIESVEFRDFFWYINLTAVDENDRGFCGVVDSWKGIIGEQSFFAGREKPLFTRYLNLENGSFLTFQVLLDIILRLDRTQSAREEMIEMCREKYNHSPFDLKKICHFDESYCEEDALKWYVINSFLYRLLNESLRLEDIDTLIKLRYYIGDLHNQLARLQVSYIESLQTCESVLTLYRGQRMSMIELKKIHDNSGELISMNSFLSTTKDVQAAVFFAGDGSLDDPEKEASVLYQITVDINLSHSIPFAEIQSARIFNDEGEVLFSMTAVFRIDEVEQYGNLWVVNLTLINKEDEEWNKLTAHLNK